MYLTLVKFVLIIEDSGVNLEFNLRLILYNLKEDYKYLNLNYHIGQFILCSKIPGNHDFYNRDTNFSLYFNCFIYFYYTIRWGFVFNKNIYLLLQFFYTFL